MKKKLTKALAVLLMLCMLLSQTALAATTYYVDVSIVGPDAEQVEQTVSASSSRSLATAAASFAGYRVCERIPGTGIIAFFVKGVICAVVSALVLIAVYWPLPEFKSAVALGIKVVRNHGK